MHGSDQGTPILSHDARGGRALDIVLAAELMEAGRRYAGFVTGQTTLIA